MCWFVNPNSAGCFISSAAGVPTCAAAVRKPVPHLSDACSVSFFLIRGAFSARWKHPAALVAEKL